MDINVFLLLYLQTLRDIFNPVKYVIEEKLNFLHKGNNKITELRTILQRESQNS
jgi:hypothetical protein